MVSKTGETNPRLASPLSLGSLYAYMHNINFYYIYLNGIKNKRDQSKVGVASLIGLFLYMYT